MNRRVYIETYGCQMNEYDSQIVKTILTDCKFDFTETVEDADVILLNTCSVRENAHQRVLRRISMLQSLKKTNRGLIIGVIGCMPQNLGDDLAENGIDIIAGPDSYRKLATLINNVIETGKQELALSQSPHETYSDVFPVDTQAGVNAWLAVMRGCNNYCSFCVVPYTRGRERCRAPENIIEEIRRLTNDGFQQVTLLGQNVNSYKYEGFTFARLIDSVSRIEGIRRIRFTSPHPKDFPDDLLQVVAENEKVCKHIHLPLQSGNSRILKMMNRSYTNESFLELACKMRQLIPGLVLTTDVIIGFPTETEQEFQETLDVLRKIEFDSAFMFKYSERKGTTAAKKYPDDVSEEDKTSRITRLVDMQRKISYQRNQTLLGQTFEVLVEGKAKKPDQLMGRNDGNKIVVFPDSGQKPGDFIQVRIDEVTPNTLIGIAV